MKILITGAGGQLGQAFQRLFEREDISFLALEHQALDIANFGQVKERLLGKGLTHIVNCAAYNRVDEAERNWKVAYLVNGLGTRNLAWVAEREKAVLVHFSTDYVFDGEKGSPYTIFDTPNPINRYGESKLLGERFLPLAGRSILIRTSWVFGRGGENFATRVLAWARGKEEIAVVEDELSAPTFAGDLAYATFLLMKEEALGLYHVTNSPASRLEWAEYILRRVGWKGKIKRLRQEDFKLPAKRPKYSALDNFGLAETTGFVMPPYQEATDRFLKEVGLL